MLGLDKISVGPEKRYVGSVFCLDNKSVVFFIGLCELFLKCLIFQSRNVHGTAAGNAPTMTAPVS